jgi:protein phosphatase
VYEVSEVEIDDLPVFDRQQIETSISASSLDDARTITARLATRAEACERLRATAGQGGGTQPGPTNPSEPTASPSAAPTAPPTTGAAGASSGPTATFPTGPASGTPDGSASPTTAAPTITPTDRGSSTVTRAECGIAE